jgi:peroxiredoxin
MRRQSSRPLFPFVAAFLLLLLAAAPAGAASLGDEGTVIAESMDLGDIALTPAEGPYADYLGVPAGEPFTLADIEADYLLVQVFSMYCPHCQREAPHMEALFERLQSSDHGGTLKMLGLGVGNSEYEVDFFRKEYGLTFPLFPDPDYAAYDRFGVVGTPFYALVEIEGPDGHPVLFTQEGTFEDEKAFYDLLMEEAGLE